ncbi:Deoxycytidylate deaminase [Wickerhamomyces ciferrii]|uniref:Deoxycytidylate deaminase n=1 Tax=Wickerhamomyces ciferrii (strain ATCC 14091 / BCRC 22168 / CBS 111 / JCM 3599 / NBRC 0793 / NRRL Y-1031 F-60-10) TaxID=1206466 RepID=K0K9Y4_WICCF|nr:Deoxycytidylate deaminase [Wickerhamomyces ciferrii]CCH41745.1 Deoxycytidylate deaminase [Wickerhamomyces ciferrii]
MLIGISGTLGAGKTEVARYLTFQGFKFIDYKREYNSIPNVKDLKLQDSDSELKPEILFENLQELIDYVTRNWLSNFVLTDISTVLELEQLTKRPFFLHISIDAPLKSRWERHRLNNPNSSFTEFIEISDEQTYNRDALIVEVISKASIKIINTSTVVENLYVQLSKLNLLDQTRLRPSWDAYFMRLADLAALRSNCMKRRVGCVIARDKRVIATGYNGTPRHMTNCNEGGCSRCNSGNGSGAALSTCLCLHGEENALLESGRDRIGDNAILYCNTCPCLTCSVKIVQSGIKEVVYSLDYSMDDSSSRVLKEGGVLLRQYTPPIDGTLV